MYTEGWKDEKLQKLEPGVPYYGVELEIICAPLNLYYGYPRHQIRTDKDEHIASVGSDSSLSHGGVEIRALPACKNSWSVLRILCEKIGEYGPRVDITCGNHIHVSRGALNGESHLDNMMDLIFGNPTVFFDLSQRTEASARTWSTFWPTDTTRTDTKKRKYNTAITANALNTIEFRMFAGVYRWEDLLTNLNITAAVYELCRDGVPAIDEFVSLLKSNRDIAKQISNRLGE